MTKAHLQERLTKSFKTEIINEPRAIRLYLESGTYNLDTLAQMRVVSGACTRRVGERFGTLRGVNGALA